MATHESDAALTAAEDHGWLRRQLVAHPFISYLAAFVCPLIGLALAVSLLGWRQTRRGLTVLAIAVAVIALCALSTPPGNTGANLARLHRGHRQHRGHVLPAAVARQLERAVRRSRPGRAESVPGQSTKPSLSGRRGT